VQTEGLKNPYWNNHTRFVAGMVVCLISEVTADNAKVIGRIFLQ
jgi:hypothetical protein